MRDVGSKVQRFEVVAHLGTGGVGTVLRARDPQLERDVAIKLLRAPRGSMPNLSEHATIDLRSDPQTQSDDLLHEARMMARLSHPNVLAVYEIGLVDDSVFVVMEHIDGADLRTWLGGKRRSEVLAVMAQAARGLAAAHAHDLVHGDFKPENVLVGRDGRVRVADFGLAKLDHAEAMRRVAQVGGTPRYMAPELWVGAAPTQPSDVYAYCVALAEALGARVDDIASTLHAPARLRDLAIAGIADNPARRPSMAAIVAALEGRSGWRTWWLAGAATAGLLGVLGFALLRAGDEDECTIDRSIPGTWDVSRDIILRASLLPVQPTDIDRTVVARISSNFRESQLRLDERWLATCSAARSRELTPEQVEIRRSCLTRRTIELAVRADQLVAHPRPSKLVLLLETARIPEPSECDEVTTPPIRDRAAVIALFRRVVDTEQIPTTKRAEPVLAIARDAAAIGETELAVRATIAAGTWQNDSSRLVDADRLLQLGYLDAVTIHASRLQAGALIMRARVALKQGNSQQATSLGSLALALAERGTIASQTRARIYAELGRAALERVDGQVAMETLDKGLAVVAQDGHRLPFIEASLRIDRTRAFGAFEGKKREGVIAAQETAAWLADTFGATSAMAANGLEILSSMQRWAGDSVQALATHEKAYAIKQQTMPGDPTLALTRGLLARLYEYNGRDEEARAIYVALLAEVEHNELIKADVPTLMVRLGVTTCAVGRCDEGYPMIERGIELGIAKYGADSDMLSADRDALLLTQIELGKLDEAEKGIAALRRVWQANPQRHARSLAMLSGSEAFVALARGHAAHAEQQTRAALATWKELKGDDLPRSGLLANLADTLIAQGKWEEAKEPAAESYAIQQAAHFHAGSLAEQEVRLAQIEAGLGDVDSAKQRAERARAALPPMSKIARSRADALLRRR